MRHIKDVGFVIKRINFGDADRYVTVFTREQGKIEVVAKSVRKLTSKRGAALELLNLIEFQAIVSLKNLILTETKILSTCSGLKSDYDKIPAVFLMCELIDKLCAEHQKNETIFNLLFNTITQINTSEDLSSIRKFQIELLAILGFWDRKKEFKTYNDANIFIENILERKVKTRMVFEV